MRIGITIKWTASAVLLVIIVVCVYAVFMIQDAQESVQRETEHIQKIQYEALDQLGAQTTNSISQPASGLLYDNDRNGLTKLLTPVVEGGASEQSYFALYTALIAPNGLVWATALNKDYDKLDMYGKTFFDRKSEDASVVEIDAEHVKVITDKAIPRTEDVWRKTIASDGSQQNVRVREYIQAIKDGSEVQGYLLIGYSIYALESEIAKIKNDGEVRKTEALNRAILMALIAIVVGLFFGILQSILVTRNIKKLSKTASQIASGDLAVRSDVHAHDEIGQLGEQFNIMADRVQALLVETEQKAMLEKEVDIARSIQSTLLPDGGAAQCGPVQLYGYFQPASECGGDFWSYDKLPDGSILLTIGDVTGHGVPSAMITACAKSALDTLLSMAGRNVDLSHIVSSINTAICKTAKRTLFMTFFALRIAANGSSCEMVNAGHNFPLLIRGGEVRGLVARGERLGDNPDASYDIVRSELSPGDMFLLFTDGLTEYQNETGAEYGEKHLRKVVAPLGAGNVSDAMQHLWADFQNFTGNAPQNDDITLMFAKIG